MPVHTFTITFNNISNPFLTPVLEKMEQKETPFTLKQIHDIFGFNTSRVRFRCHKDIINEGPIISAFIPNDDWNIDSCIWEVLTENFENIFVCPYRPDCIQEEDEKKLFTKEMAEILIKASEEEGFSKNWMDTTVWEKTITVSIDFTEEQMKIFSPISVGINGRTSFTSYQLENIVDYIVEFETEQKKRPIKSFNNVGNILGCFEHNLCERKHLSVLTDDFMLHMDLSPKETYGSDERKKLSKTVFEAYKVAV